MDANRARQPRFARRATPWLVAGLLLLVLGTAASVASARGVPLLSVAPEVGYAHPGSANESFNLTLTDAPSFAPRFLTANPGSNVSILLDNNGSNPHTFTLSSQSKVTINLTISPSQLNQTFVTHPPIISKSVAPGQKLWANFSLAANTSFDSFEFVSVVPYQFQAGMWGLLNLSSTAAGLELSENTTNTPGFLPDVLGATPAHYPIVIAVLVTNEGSLGHTFTLAPQSNVSLSPTNYSDYFSDHAPLVNANVPALTGGTAWANFTISAPGIYEYICEISGHFAAGMYGFLYVGIPVPPPAPAPSTAIVDGWVLAGSAILVGIGVLFVAVASLAGRFPPRSSPPGPHH